MPIIPSKYQPPKAIFRIPDISTLYSGIFRKVNGIQQTRERMQLTDGDFLDLEWSHAKEKTDRCFIPLHGLEGHARRPYIQGVAKIFTQNGFDCCAVNYRGCSGEDNTTFASYHSGKTDDLREVIHHVVKKGGYKTIVLNGFSLGGNLALKCCGEENLPEEIKALIAVSAPVDLEGSMWNLKKRRNYLYSKSFLFELKRKLKLKALNHPELITKKDIKAIRTLRGLDNFYTAKANGYRDAIDYYTQNSSKQFLKNITIPTLIINAKNDSFLSESCYPTEDAQKNPNIFLEIPSYGGHVGFIESGEFYYNEKRAVEFVLEHLNN